MLTSLSKPECTARVRHPWRPLAAKIFIIIFFKNIALIQTKLVSFETLESELYSECSLFEKLQSIAELFADKDIK